VILFVYIITRYVVFCLIRFSKIFSGFWWSKAKFPLTRTRPRSNRFAHDRESCKRWYMGSITELSSCYILDDYIGEIMRGMQQRRRIFSLGGRWGSRYFGIRLILPRAFGVKMFFFNPTRDYDIHIPLDTWDLTLKYAKLQLKQF